MRCSEGKHEEDAALVVQAQKVLHQVAVDAGEWQTGVLLWPAADPLGRDEFAGSMREMKDVHSFKKALTELRSKHRGSTDGDEEEKPKSEAGHRRKGKAKAAAAPKEP